MNYNSINNNLLSLFGIEPHLTPLGDERVCSQRGLYFGVSTDVGRNNITNFIFVTINILFILLLNWISSFLSKDNPFRKTIKIEKKNMIFGQVINLLIPFTLPWTFEMLNNGVRNVGTKLNTALYFFVFFVALFFPIYYFFQLL